MNCGEAKPAVEFFGCVGMIIRSQAWRGIGRQEGSETSGVSPNNKPCSQAPGLLFDHTLSHFNCVAIVFGSGGVVEEDEIVQASWKHEGLLNPLVAGSNPAGRT